MTASIDFEFESVLEIDHQGHERWKVWIDGSHMGTFPSADALGAAVGKEITNRAEDAIERWVGDAELAAEERRNGGL